LRLERKGGEALGEKEETTRMPSIAETKRQGYRLQRTASLGAHITLVARCGEFSALFECATKCAEVLGDRALRDVGDGILEVIPSYCIPVEELNLALQKLSKRFSIALVEYAMTRQGGQFVTLWKIERTTVQQPPSTDINDY